MSLAAQTTPLIAALEQLGPHDHFCSIYESPQEHYAVAIPFIRIGLERGEKCIYIADDGAVGDVRQAMQAEGIDVDREIASKALVLATKDQTYLEHGAFHPDWMFTFWRETTELAMSEGFSALRATGETEWVLRGGRGLERWMEYESRLTHTLSESKCSALCQYNRRLFPPEVILDVIRTHPTIVYGSTVCRNLYYVPPEEFLGANQPAREVERLLTNIRERERVDNALREQLKERKRAEEALRRSESYLAEAQRLTHTGSWAFNAITPLYWSEENCRIWGFDPQQGLPDRETMWQRIHPEDRDRVVEYVQNAVRERRDYAVEFRVVLPDGAVRYIHGLGHTAFSASGELVEVVGTNVDVTERKRAEMLLSGEKRLLEMIAKGDSLALILDALCRLVEELADGCLSSILLLDPNTNRLRHGSAPSLSTKYAEAIDGIVIGQSVGSCGTAAYRREPVIVSDIATDPLWADYREMALAHGLRACWSTPILSSERKVLGTFAIYYREPRNPSRQEHELMAQITHLTSIAIERKQREEALHQAQTDLAHVSRVTTMGELTASLAHEVNQPITAAVTNAKTCVRWLAGDAPNIEEAREAAMRSAKNGTRAAEIIGRIRLLFQKGTPKREPVDINEVIREIIVLLRGEATRYSISVRTELDTMLPRLMGDSVQLQQVFMNLLLNGIEAMKDVDDKRELFIKSERWENEQVLVSVHDTGSGLPPQQADHIFDAFFTTKLHGTGMGLSISRSIVESHGGRLWADGNSPRGATFHIALPTGVEAH
jgi:PAS domain S-box-containing protein